MSKELFARTGRKGKNGVPAVQPQTYREHILGVYAKMNINASEILAFCKLSVLERKQFLAVALLSAEFHDLGKLDAENQKVLCGCDSRASLPYPHEDAGAAYFMKCFTDTKNREYIVPAMMVFSHHAGLPNIEGQGHRQKNEKNGFRLRIEECLKKQKELIQHVDSHLEEYLAKHKSVITDIGSGVISERLIQWTGLQRRLALSCLIDADYSDASEHSDPQPEASAIPCRWEERLESLRKHVANLKNERRSSPERQAVRDDVFNECLNQPVSDASMETCCGTLGVGKTTAVIARLIQVAIKRGLRRIIVVLPYTNIIQQSVESYRKALALPGEDPEKVVAEHHHLADFDDESNRRFSELWNAPIVVTTAVQFFETLGSNKPSALRKLHNVPGSGVFIDESHNVMPVNLWPQEWKWMKELSSDWNCHFVFASASLIKFWENPDFIKDGGALPEILSPELQSEMRLLESKRIIIKRIKRAFTLDKFCNELCKEPHKSKLVVVNTVFTAAALASRLKKRSEIKVVLHLSTALTPADRTPIIEQTEALTNPKEGESANQNENNPSGVILIATSCVEAGMNFSFNKAYHEAASVASLIQIAGRANRNGEMNGPAEIFSFNFCDTDEISHNPGLDISSQILNDLFEQSWFDDDSKTTDDILQEAFCRELEQQRQDSEKLVELEQDFAFADVAQKCKVIDSRYTVPVVMKPEIVAKLESGQPVSRREIQLNSVQIWRNNEKTFGYEPIKNHPGLYKWTQVYDPEFLGYMTEIVQKLIIANKIKEFIV